MPFQSVQCHYVLYTKPYWNWIDWPSLWRSNLCKKYCRIISNLSPAKPYLYPSHTMCFLNHTDSPLFPPLLSPLPLTTPPHHSPSPLPLTTPPHHSPLPLTTPILLTPPHTIPHYHFSSLPSPLFTPMHSPLYPTTHHHSPHYSLSLPLTTPHHPSPPTLLTTPLHHPLHPSRNPQQCCGDHDLIL